MIAKGQEPSRQWKKTWPFLTMAGLVLSTGVLLSLAGFNRGCEGSLPKDMKNMGFPLLVKAKGGPEEAVILMLKGGRGLRHMQPLLASLAREPEVEEVTPILRLAVFDPHQGESGGIAEYFGVEIRSFTAWKPFLKFRQGGWFTGEEASEVVMGYEAAKLEQREAGDLLLIPEKNVPFRVAGILERTGTQDDGTIFLPLPTLPTVFGRPGEITATIGIKLKRGADSARLEEKLGSCLTKIIPVSQEAPHEDHQMASGL